MSLTPVICPISQRPISIPGFLHCGHEFEKKEIVTWIAIGAKCPTCREVCNVMEISDTAQEAAQKATRLVENQLRATELERETQCIRTSTDTTIAQSIQRRLNDSSREIASKVLYSSEDANRLYQLFMSRSLTRLAQNTDSILIAAGVQDANVRVVDTPLDVGQKFELEFKRAFATHILVAVSPLKLHALMEDRAMHEMINPPAYMGLLSCESQVSSRELAREYMLCEQMQCLERDICLADSGIPVADMSPSVMPSVYNSGMLPLTQCLTIFEILQPIPNNELLQRQQATAQHIKLLYPFWHDRMLAHLNSIRRLQGGLENANSIELFGDGCTLQESEQAFTRAQVEFLLSTILMRSLPKEEDRKEQSKALEVLEGLAEQINHPISGAKVKISQRLYQILGALLPPKDGETSEEAGRSALPLLFHMVHPKAILYAIAQLRSELYASWQFTDSTDYQQKWTDMQETMRTVGHL